MQNKRIQKNKRMKFIYFFFLVVVETHFQSKDQITSRKWDVEGVYKIPLYPSFVLWIKFKFVYDCTDGEDPGQRP